jgi:hypothetical protein
MNTFSKATLLAIALVGIGTANAEWLNPERAVEAERSAVTLPQYDAGTISVSQCESCEPLRFELTAATRYFVAPQTPAVSLDVLRSAFFAGAHDEGMLVGVFFDPDTRAVNRLVLSPSD